MTPALTDETTRDKIRSLNDDFRRYVGITQPHQPDRHMMTRGVARLDDDAWLSVFDGVRRGNATDDLHSSGSFDQAGVGRVSWQIACYDPSLSRPSDHPGDEERTARVLTIMLEDEQPTDGCVPLWD